MSSGVKVEVEYLRSLLQEEVIKRDLIEGDEAKAGHPSSVANLLSRSDSFL
jgi:hypothetical protein